MNRTRFLAVTLAALIAGATTGLTSSALASNVNGTIQGAGSTLVAPLMAKWSHDFESKNNIQVKYGPIGSGAGIAQISARTVDFGASDAPLNPTQAAGCHGCVQIPWALTATGIAFHLNGVPTLKLSGPVIAQIYLRKIKKWNSPIIQKLNKGEKLPNVKITPVFRSDGSGDTYAFTDFLSRVSKTWKSKIGFGTAVSFPTSGSVGGKGNDGITALVSSTNGAIGYISASYIIAHGLQVAALENRAKRFIYPNLKNISAAAALVKHVPANNEMHIVNPPKKAKTAYPLCTFTYVIVPKAAPKKTLLSKFILYAISQGQKFGAALDFAPIPKIVITAAKGTVAKL